MARQSESEKLPIVDMNVVLKASSENRNNKHVFPTPESPISSNLNKRSYVFLAIAMKSPYYNEKVQLC